jgi:YegS/Rv2252/BmrU family lipid kinase
VSGIRSALLIVNPAARQAAAREGGARAALARAGVAFDVARTERPGHASELAAAACGRYDAVFTLGGDGTTMEVVGALAGTRVPVGALPGGTGNLVARTLGTPLRVERAVAALLAGTRAEVDLGVVEASAADGTTVARRFAFAAGVGIDARMIEETPARLKRRLGVLAYALTAGRALLARERFAVRVSVDGEEIRREASAVMIVNFGAVLGDLFWFGPDIRHDDGRLDVCLFSPRTLADAVRVLWRLSRKDFREDRALLYRSGVSFRVETDPPRAVEADGELLGRTPLEVRVEPLAATLLVPRAKG